MKIVLKRDKKYKASRMGIKINMYEENLGLYSDYYQEF